MPSSAAISRAELVVIGLFLAWLVWLPLPFGSVIERARLPLVVIPLLLCLASTLLRISVTADRSSPSRPTKAWLFWAGGTVALLFLGVVQVLPLPEAVVRLLSSESWTIWSGTRELVALAGLAMPKFHLSVDPFATGAEILRLMGIAASFMTAAMLLRTHERRTALAVALCAAGLFESLYGLRESALQRYEIWGWVNRLIFNRVTGTFVNPNHFADYLAIVLPMPLFLVAVQWHRSGSPRAPFHIRLLSLFERAALRTGLALLVAVSCSAGFLLAQSRGALLALAIGLLTAVAITPGRRATKVAASAIAGLALVVGLVAFLGPERTVKRFAMSRGEAETLVGRRIGMATAVRIWQRFPIFGSGLGTFERVVSMEQSEARGAIYHHAHNDYLEMAATAGGIGIAVALVSLLGGWLALLRMTNGPGSEDLSWNRKAWQIAALAALTIAMVHSLVDFNFFIPSNPATLAAIVGAAVSSLDRDRRGQRSVRGQDTATRR